MESLNSQRLTSRANPHAQSTTTEILRLKYALAVTLLVALAMEPQQIYAHYAPTRIHQLLGA